MSGLFARMAQRARGGDAGGVRILVPTLFEPEAEPPAHVPTPESRELGERANAAPTATVVTNALAVTRAAASQPPTHSLESTAVDGGVATMPRDHVPLVANPTSPSGAPAPRRDDTARDPLVRRASAPSTVDRSIARRDDRVAAHTAPLADEPPGDERSAPAHEHDPGARADEMDATGDDLLLARKGPRAPARAGKRDVPAQPGTHAPREATAEARPIVKVTIGRIDVRPSPNAPTAAPPRPARHQAMGLDEYLKRRDTRDGGGR